MAQYIEKKIRFIPPEIPKGEMLIQRVFGLARRALTETYPILSNPPYCERLPTLDRIRFASLDQIRKQQETDKPPTNLLYLGMELSGIPKPAIHQRYYPLNEENPVYWDHSLEKPVMYFSDRFPHNFSSPNPGERVTESIVFGATLIRETLKMLPTPRQLTPNSEWQAIITSDLAFFFENLENEFAGQINPENFTMLKGYIDHLQDLDSASFVLAHGAMVSLLLSGQTLTNAEYTMGIKLDGGVVSYLAQDVTRGFIILMKSARIAPDLTKLSDFYAAFLIPDEWQRFAENIFRRIQLVDFTNKQKLLELYLNSELPIYYHNSPRRGTIDPKQYPR